MHNYYDILGISCFATEEQIDKAIELGSTVGGLGINVVQEIKTYLKNPVARRLYDLQLIDFYAGDTNAAPRIRLSTKVLQDLIDMEFNPPDPVDSLPKLSEADLAQRIEEELARSKMEQAKKKMMFLDMSIATVIMFIGLFLMYMFKLKIDAIITGMGG